MRGGGRGEGVRGKGGGGRGGGVRGVVCSRKVVKTGDITKLLS